MLHQVAQDSTHRALAGKLVKDQRDHCLGLGIRVLDDVARGPTVVTDGVSLSQTNSVDRPLAMIMHFLHAGQEREPCCTRRSP
jgi:hypothetical protein